MPRSLRRLPLLLLTAGACTVSRVPPAVRPLAAPLPLTVLVCSPSDPTMPRPLGDDGVMFARVVAPGDAAARPDLVAHLRTTPRTTHAGRTSAGFFIWTLAVVPLLHHAERTATVELRRAAPGADPCAALDAPPLALTATPRERMVSGWVAQLFLRPTPWWSEADLDAPRGDPKLAREARLELARLVEERRREIMALAGR